MLKIGISSISVITPGLNNWEAAIPVFRGEQPYQATELPKLKPELLPANERRRANQTIKLALQASIDAIENSPYSHQEMNSVFASSVGDNETAHKICLALNAVDKPVSPTQFHNSVHNAPGGYWSIAAHSHAASVSLSAYAGTFAAGMLETATTVIAENRPVLLVSYDVPAPFPLTTHIPIEKPFAMGLVLAPYTESESAITMEVVAETTNITNMEDPILESLRLSSHAARSLPLLKILAECKTAKIALPYLDGTQLNLSYQP